MTDRNDCDGCHHSRVPGVRPDAPGECPAGFIVVERCDACERFADDLEAAAAYGTDARWESQPDPDADPDDVADEVAICRPPAGEVRPFAVTVTEHATCVRTHMGSVRAVSADQAAQLARRFAAGRCGPGQPAAGAGPGAWSTPEPSDSETEVPDAAD